MRPGTRFVSHHLEQGPGCDFVPPLEAVRPIDGLLGLRGSHHGQFAGRADGTNVVGRASEPPADSIHHHRAQKPERRGHRAVLGVDQFRAARDDDRLFELADLERQRNRNRLADRKPALDYRK